MSKPGRSQRRQLKGIDRLVPGVRSGRITIRTSRLSDDATDELDKAITRAIEKGELGALILLRERKVTPIQFLAAHRENRLASLKAASQLVPLVEQWLAVGAFGRSTKVRYAQSWRLLYASLPDDPSLDDLTNRWWTVFVSARLGKVNAATINRDRAALLSFYNWAGRQGYTLPELSPAKHREEPVQSELLTPQQVRAIREKCRRDRWPFFWTLLETGARQGEVLNLKGPDIDPTHPVIRFLPQDGSKSKKVRTVRIVPELHNYLLTVASLAGTGRIFKFSRWEVQRWWTDLCKQLGIRGVTLHGLRATFITNALDAGVPSVTVRSQVGHSSITMTERYYRSPAENLDVTRRIRVAIGLVDSEQGGGDGAEPQHNGSTPVPALFTAPRKHAGLDNMG